MAAMRFVWWQRWRQRQACGCVCVVKAAAVTDFKHRRQRLPLERDSRRCTWYSAKFITSRTQLRRIGNEVPLRCALCCPALSYSCPANPPPIRLAPPTTALMRARSIRATSLRAFRAVTSLTTLSNTARLRPPPRRHSLVTIFEEFNELLEVQQVDKPATVVTSPTSRRARCSMPPPPLPVSVRSSRWHAQL